MVRSSLIVIEGDDEAAARSKTEKGEVENGIH